jgi:hypothetical protein
MVVSDLHVEGISLTPPKADSPLLVDTDAVLASPVALQCFEPIAGRNTQIEEGASTVEVQELAPRHPLDGTKSPNVSVVKQSLRVTAPKASDHTVYLLRAT